MREAQRSEPPGRQQDRGREAFLNAIASRLGRARVTAQPPRSATEASEPAPVFDPATLVERFVEELKSLGATCQCVASLAELHQVLRQELTRWQARRMISWARPELSCFQLDWLWDELGCVPLTGNREAALSADVGITGADWALALTGTLVLSAAEGRPRSVSLLPTVHVALVREAQLLASMGEALASYRGSRASPAAFPSAVHFISGPSRTSDIENDHTIGVHGPAAVSVILWRGSESDSAAPHSGADSR